MVATPSLDPELEKRRLFQTFTRFFQRPPSPTLIVIEDIHWSDDSSLEFLISFARRIASQPLLLLLTYRHDEVYGHAELRLLSCQVSDPGDPSKPPQTQVVEYRRARFVFVTP